MTVWLDNRDGHRSVLITAHSSDRSILNHFHQKTAEEP